MDASYGIKEEPYNAMDPELIKKRAEMIKSNEKFARDISKNSKTLVIMVNQKQDLVNFFKNNLKGNEIVIGMGAGSISGWLKELKNFLKQ